MMHVSVVILLKIPKASWGIEPTALLHVWSSTTSLNISNATTIEDTLTGSFFFLFLGSKSNDSPLAEIEFVNISGLAEG